MAFCNKGKSFLKEAIVQYKQLFAFWQENYFCEGQQEVYVFMKDKSIIMLAEDLKEKLLELKVFTDSVCLVEAENHTIVKMSEGLDTAALPDRLEKASSQQEILGAYIDFLKSNLLL